MDDWKVKTAVERTAESTHHERDTTSALVYTWDGCSFHLSFTRQTTLLQIEQRVRHALSNLGDTPDVREGIVHVLGVHLKHQPLVTHGELLSAWNIRDVMPKTGRPDFLIGSTVRWCGHRCMITDRSGYPVTRLELRWTERGVACTRRNVPVVETDDFIEWNLRNPEEGQ